MEDLYTEIVAYNKRCIELNALLYQKYKSRIGKEQFPFFNTPMAMKEGQIPKTGSFALPTGEEIGFAFHGTGITFSLDEGNLSFEYFPIIGESGRPILSLDRVVEFLESKNKPGLDFSMVVEQFVALAKENLVKLVYAGYLTFYLA